MVNRAVQRRLPWGLEWGLGPQSVFAGVGGFEGLWLAFSQGLV